MNSTQNKIFVDSNIILYLFDQDENKKKFVQSLGDNKHYISTQVVNENVNVCLKKFKFNTSDSLKHGKYLIDKFKVVYLTEHTLQKGYQIFEEHSFSFWDSLIVASAIESGCDFLYSMDMQEGRVIGKTKIINPFNQN